MDKRHFALSLIFVVSLYAIMLVYIYATAGNTIRAIERNMASMSVPLLVSSATFHDKPQQKNKNPDTDLHKTEIQPGLIEGLSAYDETIGQLPVIRKKDNLTSFRAYQSPFSLQVIGDKAALSFVVKDFGLSKELSNLALDILPPEVSFLLSPYALLPQEWINRARAKGHEVWLEIPLQRGLYNDAGLYTIYHHDSLVEKGINMRKSLAKALGYTGVALFSDQGTAENKDHYSKLIEELYGRGLAVLELNSDAPRFVESLAASETAPYIKVTDTLMHISQKDIFLPIEKTAQEKKQAVTMVPAYPVLIKALALWLEKIGKIDYVIAPVSVIYDLPLARIEQVQKQTDRANIE
ncbi:MAG: divergent polysaccharide deacetylase family protein [Alphaproteobacteria bacterium]